MTVILFFSYSITEEKSATTVRQYLTALFMAMFNFLITARTIEDANTEYAEELKIVTDIEGGNAYNVRRLSENHFSIQMKPESPSVFKYPDHHSYWFYFKVEGAVGKGIKMDITNCDWMPSHWKKYKPVYTYAKDPDSLAGVVWHRIEKTRLTGNTFSFVQRFEENPAWVALRYPYNYTREKRYIKSIRKNEYVDVEELGKTAMSNPLYMVVVTDKKAPKDRKKGVLVYAREHGVEQDGSWVTEGMIDFLLSSEPLANILRRNVIFMVVPVISPDSVILGRTVDPTTGEYTGRELVKNKMDSIEATLLYNRVKRFTEEGGTLDISISLHNPHGTEPNIYPHYRPYNDVVRLEKSMRLHKAILKNSKGYTKWKEFTLKSCLYSVGRFARDFGSIAILYEVNHQAKNNYLTLEKLRSIGGVILKGIAEYYG